VSEPSTGRPGAPSPYVSLREAVRPAIFAYSILASERERGGALVEECDEVLQLTRELLRKSALAHLLTPEPGPQMPAGADGTGDRQARLLDAYADVGMLWAQVIGNCMAIAGVLLERGEWAKLNHLAGTLTEVGETASGSELSRLVLAGPEERARRIIGKVHGAMSLEEIHAALDALRTLPRQSPIRDEALESAFTIICRSVDSAFPSASAKDISNVKHIVKNGCTKDNVYHYLPYVLREFSALQHQQERNGAP